ncbi:hypothetical protein OIO90_002964 [Microbotryomycetes sp. JL221]|nr:hypothetical protein OIO90_002964 [Microbotryomycetes sp. JL221]
MERQPMQIREVFEVTRKAVWAGDLQRHNVYPPSDISSALMSVLQRAGQEGTAEHQLLVASQPQTLQSSILVQLANFGSSSSFQLLDETNAPELTLALTRACVGTAHGLCLSQVFSERLHHVCAGADPAHCVASVQTALSCMRQADLNPLNLSATSVYSLAIVTALECVRVFGLANFVSLVINRLANGPLCSSLDIRVASGASRGSLRGMPPATKTLFDQFKMEFFNQLCALKCLASAYTLPHDQGRVPTPVRHFVNLSLQLVHNFVDQHFGIEAHASFFPCGSGTDSSVEANLDDAEGNWRDFKKIVEPGLRQIFTNGYPYLKDGEDSMFDRCPVLLERAEVFVATASDFITHRQESLGQLSHELLQLCERICNLPPAQSGPNLASPIKAFKSARTIIEQLQVHEATLFVVKQDEHLRGQFDKHCEGLYNWKHEMVPQIILDMPGLHHNLLTLTARQARRNQVSELALRSRYL